MKKFWVFVFVVVFLFGCANETAMANSVHSGKIKVITTIFAPFDFVREIVGDSTQIEVSMLLPPATEVHSYEPSPKDILTIQNSELFIYIGGDSDYWVDVLLNSFDDKVKTIELLECVDLLDDDYEHYHYDGKYMGLDPHVWTSPKNAKVIVSAIAEEICRIEPENADLYRKNAAEYLEKLTHLDTQFQDVVDNAARQVIVFGDRFPFRYFAQHYGLEFFAAFPGCSAQTEPSAAMVAFLIDEVNEKNIPAVFHAELSDKKMATAISEATGAKVSLLHSCHNVTKDELESNVSYLDLMQMNLITLKEALN
ncbi:MAG: metal ABC transporter substrate-binding protein [Oscillospiraceae bacterium]|nr:metal ABC transporter substrate-binding protein [Oscillospiraceae bacterium]